MNYSKAHQHFCYRRGTTDVYDNSEKYLGPNYQAVLNFWWYLESLTIEQLLELESKYRDSGRYTKLVHVVDKCLGSNNRACATDASRKPVRDIIMRFPNIPAPVTLELIAMHDILERGESLIYVPMLFS